MRTGTRRLGSLLLLLPLLAGGTGPTLEVSNARIRWLPGPLPMAAYCELHNRGEDELVLIGASSSFFADIDIHRSIATGGIARMQAVQRLRIGPGETISLAPGAYHLMLRERNRPVAVGDRVPIRLHFADGSKWTAEFLVRDASSD